MRGGELLKGMQLKHEGIKHSAGPGRGKKTVEQKEPTVSPLKSLGLTPSESKRRAVETLLRDDEWSRKSDRWVAEKCGVGHQLVGQLRGQLDDSSTSDAESRKGKDGKSYPASKPKKPKTDVTPDDVKRARDALEEIDAKRDFEKAIEAEKPPTRRSGSNPRRGHRRSPRPRNHLHDRRPRDSARGLVEVSHEARTE